MLLRQRPSANTTTRELSRDSGARRIGALIRTCECNAKDCVLKPYEEQEISVIKSQLNINRAAQHCFAADAAGAAPGLGAILGLVGVPPLVPI